MKNKILYSFDTDELKRMGKQYLNRELKQNEIDSFQRKLSGSGIIAVLGEDLMEILIEAVDRTKFKRSSKKKL